MIIYDIKNCTKCTVPIISIHQQRKLDDIEYTNYSYNQLISVRFCSYKRESMHAGTSIKGLSINVTVTNTWVGLCNNSLFATGDFLQKNTCNDMMPYLKFI